MNKKQADNLVLGDRVIAYADAYAVYEKYHRRYRRGPLSPPVEGIVTGVRWVKEGHIQSWVEKDGSFHGFTIKQFKQTNTIKVILVTFSILKNPLICFPSDVEFVDGG